MHPYGSCGLLRYGERMVLPVPRFCGLVSWSPSLDFWLDILSLGARIPTGPNGPGFFAHGAVPLPPPRARCSGPSCSFLVLPRGTSFCLRPSLTTRTVLWHFTVTW